MREFKLPSTDGRSELTWYLWEPSQTPKAILQIVHGMTEYVLRYDAFAEYLTQNGVLVVGDDHIGHGHSVSKTEDLGWFGESDGWKHMVDDEEKLRQTVSGMYPGIPYVMLGHSMGSFIARAYLAQYGDRLDAAIIMGTAGTNPAAGAGMTLVKLLRGIFGARHRSKFITNMAFGSYNKRIPGAKYPHAWLTRDESIVAPYEKDPFCTFTFTTAGYQDLFNLISYISGDDWYGKVPADLPILVTAGMEDPVGAYGAGPAEVLEKLEKSGHSEVSGRFYEEMRHEILNEIGKDVVWADMRDFILDAAADAEGPQAEAGARACASDAPKAAANEA